jgi:hypothetical protein
VESAPAGGYRSVLRIGGAKVIDYAGAVALGPYTALPFTFPAGWSNWGSGLEPVRVRQTPDALVHVNGVCVANVGPYAHGWVIMTGLPAPGTQVPVPIFLGGGSEWAGGIVFPDGSLQFDQFAGAAPAAGTGVHLNFAYWPSGL